MAKQTLQNTDALQIPCTLYKITTLPNGGWRLTFDVPETKAREVRELIGYENQQNFVMVLAKIDAEES